MRTFADYVLVRENADYCAGLSVNADFWWQEGKDTSFLTVAGSADMEKTLVQATQAGKMKVVDKRMTKYGADPQFGFSYLVVLGQSHIMIHTWPERQMMNLDVFTCGNEGDPHVILEFLKNRYRPDHVQMNQMQRGVRKDIHSTQEKPDTPRDLKPVSAAQPAAA